MIIKVQFLALFPHPLKNRKFAQAFCISKYNLLHVSAGVIQNQKEYWRLRITDNHVFNQVPENCKTKWEFFGFSENSDFSLSPKYKNTDRTNQSLLTVPVTFSSGQSQNQPIPFYANWGQFEGYLHMLIK